MAKNKKSFILYCDYIHTFNQLPDDVAGRLIKHLFSYVNDENPETDELLINAVFEPIKQQLKRDLKKYEGIQERNKVNGAKGGRPSKNPKNPVGLSGNPKNPKKPDTVTDTVTDTEISISLLEKKVKKVVDRFKETDYSAKERSFKTDKDNLVVRLEEFLEENKLNEEFENKQYGPIITWFWRWLNYNKPKEVVVKSNIVAPWITGSK